jgi:hypothetical protein
VAQSVESDPGEPVRLDPVPPAPRERRWLPPTSYTVVDNELGLADADREQPPSTAWWRSSAAATKAGIGRSRRPAFDSGGPKWRAPSAAVSVWRTCTVPSEASPHRSASTSSRRRVQPSARWTAASHGSSPRTASRIAAASSVSITVKSLVSPTGRWTSSEAPGASQVAHEPRRARVPGTESGACARRSAMRVPPPGADPGPLDEDRLEVAEPDLADHPGHVAHGVRVPLPGCRSERAATLRHLRDAWEPFLGKEPLEQLPPAGELPLVAVLEHPLQFALSLSFAALHRPRGIDHAAHP